MVVPEVFVRSRFLFAVAVTLLWVAPASIAGGTDPDHVITLSDAAGVTGSIVDLTVTYDNTSADVVLGWSYGVGHDIGSLTLESVQMGATAAAFGSGAGPDFYQVADYGDGWTVGVVISFLGGASLPPGTGYELNVATYTVDMPLGESTDVFFSETFGSPIPVLAVFVTNLGFGESTPVMESGTVTTEDPANPDHILTLGDATTVQGSAVDVSILYDNLVDDVQGWSYGVAHDPAALTLNSVVQGATTAGLNGSVGPDFHMIDLYVDGWTVGTVVSFLGSESLPPGTGYELDLANYSALQAAGENTEICLVGTLGDPSETPVVVVVGGVSLTPTTQCGTVDVVAGGIRRGDVNGDGITNASDLDDVLDYFWMGGPPSFDCQGEVDPESADVNDNEWLTVADYIQLNAALAGETSIPAPSASCGADPSDDQAGFDGLDPDYQIRIGDLTILGTDPSLPRPIFFPVIVESPADSILGFTAVLSFDSSSLSIPGDPADAFVGLGTGVVVAADASTLIVSRWNATPGAPLIGSQVGVLQLTLAPFAVFPPLEWITEITVNEGSEQEFSYRATVVDENYQDHHPELLVGAFEFARGNANGDGSVDIGDAISMLSFLFSGGEEPHCLDAADVNNDSTINIADPIYTLAYLFADGPLIPAPFPQCGLDAGPIDLIPCAEPEEGDACFFR